MPTILAGIGILAVVALLVFWPSADDKKNGKDGKDGKTAASAQGRSGKSGTNKAGAGARGEGGVGARDADRPQNPNGERIVRRNPALPQLPGLGMAPGVPDVVPPPKFDNVEQEITYYEKKLDKANTQLEMRERAVKRTEKIKGQVERGEHDKGHYEQSKKIVEANRTRAQKTVADLSDRLKNLRDEE